ncbi:S-adenosylmethionine sensor upstream of mTORC1 [Neodiprion virginianus]|uniref:S-adenosylmethionine sensor upstream of mTORC1 n=1 Tax=Neodiprion virginianus TaxID=2961670 RepID=UPI001EE69E57|nr:S-adenosylmethionine sensor upstream of mTORC1 [Neodiprion virginianus]
MASTEHKDLAAFIKSVHSNLRKESQIYGPETAWRRHVAESDTLQKYAEAMQKLATKHWAENVADPKKNTKCRIDWVKSQCWEYFFRGGIELFWDREVNINRKITNDQSHSGISTYQEWSDSENSTSGLSDGLICSNSELTPVDDKDTPDLKKSLNKHCSMKPSTKFEKSTENNLQISNNEHDSSIVQASHREDCKVKLLDVGSCYNPFGGVNFFDVTAIDLAPSCDGVLQCDFLSMQIGQEDVFSANKQQVEQLTVGSFDTVVFCLLLEYLPSPEQRYACCKKAYNLLKSGGLLLIITPDSKHVGANARFMKSWRYVLSNLGFMRAKYEKLPHAHCLAFRKCFYKRVATRWASLQKFSKDDELFHSDTNIFIPQDFTTWTREDTVECVSGDKKADVNFYNELPYT